jgi:hypothetical protein
MKTYEQIHFHILLNLLILLNKYSVITRFILAIENLRNESLLMVKYQSSFNIKLSNSRI